MYQKPKNSDEDSFEYETVRDMSYLEGNQFSVVGSSGADKQDDIN